MSQISADTVMLLIVAILNSYSIWSTRKTAVNIALLEKNTNSIKDALVASTAKASKSEGIELGRAEERNK